MRRSSIFALLTRIGFREIEVGFPSASQIEFDFTRRLIDENRIPDGVAIQILCQCREDLITRTLESLKGAQERHLPPLQLDLPEAARICLQPAQAGNRRDRGQGDRTAKARGRRPYCSRHAPAPGVFAREFHEHRARFRARDLRGRLRRLEPDAEGQDHPEPARDRRVRDAQRPRRPDRVDVHAPDAA